MMEPTPGLPAGAVGTIAVPAVGPIDDADVVGSRRARPLLDRPTLVVIVGSLGTAVLGLAAVIGYAFGSSSIASAFTGPHPVAAISGLCLIALATSTFLRRSDRDDAKRASRILAICVAAISVVEVLAALSVSKAAGTLPVPLHPHPVTSALFLLASVAGLPRDPKRSRIGLVSSSVLLVVSLALLFGYVFAIRWVVDPDISLIPVLPTTWIFLSVAIADLSVAPAGWVRLIYSRSSAGMISRLLLPSAIGVPLLTAIVVHRHGETALLSSTSLTIIVAANMVFAAALILGGGTALQRREQMRERLVAIVESSADAIYGETANGVIETWNPAAESIFGYTSREAIGASVTMLAPPERQPEIESILNRLRQGERVPPFETVRMRKDGRRIDVSLTMAPIHDSAGAVAGGSTIARDITEQKAAVARLLESESRFRWLYDSNVVGMIFWNRNGRIEDANDEFLRIVAYSRDDLRKGSLSWRDLTPAEWRSQTNEKVEEVLANGATATYEKEYLRKDGSRVPVLVGSAMGSAGTGQGIAFVLDITDRRIAEESRNARTAELQSEVDTQTAELRRRAAELEVATIHLTRANRELEAFTYSVSHDLRAPLRAMEGFSRILIDEGAGTLTDKGRDYLQRIRRATERMSKLIDDLLLLSRAGRHKLQVRDVDLSALVKTIADELRAAEPSRSNVEFVIPPGIVGPADPSVIRIALQNLIGNAWKFTSKHEAARIEFGVTDLDGERTYFIRDDGAGFDPAYGEKLFTPFQRLHSTVEFEGTGIGLALVERIISRHGGSVRAEGDVERGATFFFTLDTRAKGPGDVE